MSEQSTVLWTAEAQPKSSRLDVGWSGIDGPLDQPTSRWDNDVVSFTC